LIASAKTSNGFHHSDKGDNRCNLRTPSYIELCTSTANQWKANETTVSVYGTWCSSYHLTSLYLRSRGFYSNKYM